MGVLVTILILPLAALASNSFRVSVPVDDPSVLKTTPVSPDLFSFSIEQDRWTDWVGSERRNEFFYNTLDNLKQLAGVPPRIRVGGRSQDVTLYDSIMKGSSVVFANATSSMPYPEAIVMRVGPNFYSSAQFLPEGTRVVHGLNFASTDDFRGLIQLADIIYAFVSPPMKTAGVVLDAIEVGNEPDAYDVRSRPPGYSRRQYVNEWQAWARNALRAEDFNPGFRVSYWGASVSHLAHQKTAEWSPEALIEEGLLVSDAGRRITTISQHHYSGDACDGASGDPESLASKVNIRASLEVFKADIRASYDNEVDYVIGEAGSYTCHGAAGTSDTAAAALWALDYAFYASTLGVSRVFFHQGVGYRSNFIQPITLNTSTTDGSRLPSPVGPHVNPQYYAAIIAAEALGSDGPIRVLELPMEDERVAAYAFYKGGIPTRALFINTQPYLPSTNEGIFQTRPSVRISLELDGFPEDSSHELKRLSIPYSDSTSGIMWGGVAYESDDGRGRGEEEFECIDVGEEFVLHATEAVLVYLQEVEYVQ